MKKVLLQFYLINNLFTSNKKYIYNLEEIECTEFDNRYKKIGLTMTEETFFYLNMQESLKETIDNDIIYNTYYRNIINLDY